MENLIYIKVRKKIAEDTKKIEEMIDALVAAKEKRVCPLYQDVIDTQIYGLSKQIDLALEIGCLDKKSAKKILNDLEAKSASIYANVEESKAN